MFNFLAIDLAITAELFEIIMILCFGFSWPISIIKTLKAKTAAGKSPLFIILIINLKCEVGCEKCVFKENASKFFPKYHTSRFAPLTTLIIRYYFLLYFQDLHPFFLLVSLVAMQIILHVQNP